MKILKLQDFKNSNTFRFWHLQNFKNSDTLRFRHFLVLENSDIFRFWHIQILTLSGLIKKNYETNIFWQVLYDSDTFRFQRIMTLSGYDTFRFDILNFWHLLVTRDHGTFRFLHFPVLIFFLTWTWKFWHLQVLENLDTIRFWHFQILTLSDSNTFKFWHFQDRNKSVQNCDYDIFRIGTRVSKIVILTLSYFDTFTPPPPKKNTSSPTIAEVKQCWSRFVLGWETLVQVLSEYAAIKP